MSENGNRIEDSGSCAGCLMAIGAWGLLGFYEGVLVSGAVMLITTLLVAIGGRK